MIKYFVKDSRKLRDFLPNKTNLKPSCIITSPPYYDLKDYSQSSKQIGYLQSYDDYLNDVVDVLRQCYDVSNEKATLWLVVDTFKKNGEIVSLPTDINNKLKIERKKSRWILNDIVIWYRSKNLPWHQKGNFKNEFEYILFFSKNKSYFFNIDQVREIVDYKKWWKTYPERYNPKGKPPSNFWDYTTPIRGWGNGKQNHLCPFPFPLIERIIKLATAKNDLILDPFAGSGTVLAMAKELGRSAIGLDINAHYKKLFEEEVLRGAKDYWLKRKKELRVIESNVHKFSSLNENLRKIKASKSIIYEACKKSDKSIAFLYFPKIKKNNAVLFFVSNNTFQNGEIIDFNIVKKILKSYKVQVQVEEISKTKFFKEFSSTKFYSYLANKIYSFEDELEYDKVNSRKNHTDILYSNLKLQLD